MRVLVVDDSSTMRTIQKRSLNSLGITDVLDAKDGLEALRVLENETIDLVMTDWNMPNMDGLTLLQEIRKQTKELPVIMITTEAEKGRVVAAIQAGVSDYLAKPFTPEQLKQKVEKWVTLPAV
jgi:two-component system chemotaxis response regulator CheY